MENLLSLDMVRTSIMIHWKRILVVFGLLLLPAILLVRWKDVPYTAKIKLLLRVSSRSSSMVLGNSLAGQSASLSAIEQATLLMSQTALATSHEVFEVVKEVDPDLSGKTGTRKPGVLDAIGGAFVSFQAVVFGSDYTEARHKHKRSDFLRFKSRLNVTVDEDSSSVTLLYAHGNPEIALKAAAAAADGLNAVNIHVNTRQSKDLVKFLSVKLTEARSDLDHTSDRLVEFVRNTGVSDNPKTVEPRFQRLAGAIEASNKAALEISQRKVVLAETERTIRELENALRERLVSGSEDQLMVLSAVLRRLQATATSEGVYGSEQNPGSSQVNEMAAKLREEVRVLAEKDGALLDVKSIQKLIETAKGQEIELRSGLKGLESQATMLRSLIDRYQLELDALPEIQSKLSRLAVEHTQQLKILESLTQRYLSAQIESDSAISQLFVTEPPMLVDSFKTSKFQMLVLVLGALAILIIAGFFAYDLLTRTILMREQLTARQYPPYLASIRRLNRISEGTSFFATFRESRTNDRLGIVLKKRILERKGAKGSAVRVAVSSTEARVGKTFTAVQLAMTLKAQGLRVMVVDADYLAVERNISSKVEAVSVRVPTLVDAGKAASAGLPELQKIFSLGSHFVPVCRVTGTHPEPGEIDEVFHKHLARSVEQLGAYFDCIIFDCPPLFVTNSLLVIEITDIVLHCVAEGVSRETGIDEAADAVGRLRGTEIEMFTVLTNARFSDRSSQIQLSQYSQYRRAA